MTLFAFDDYFPAVATTDLLARVADVLCAKPSELGLLLCLFNNSMCGARSPPPLPSEHVC